MNDYMTKEDRRTKLAEIFGEQAEYFEDWFCPETDFDERDARIAQHIGKPLSMVTVGDVIETIEEIKPDVAKELKRCIYIAKDARDHGRLWTEDNQLRKLIGRTDICTLESFAMYVSLCDVLGLNE